MIVYQLLFVFTCIGIFATAMQCCWRKVSATQFTLYMTLGNLGRIAGAKLIGPVKSQFDWEFTLLLFPVAVSISWMLLRFIHINKQVEKIAQLEHEDQHRSMIAAPKIESVVA